MSEADVVVGDNGDDNGDDNDEFTTSGFNSAKSTFDPDVIVSVVVVAAESDDDDDDNAELIKNDPGSQFSEFGVDTDADIDGDDVGDDDEFDDDAVTDGKNTSDSIPEVTVDDLDCASTDEVSSSVNSVPLCKYSSDQDLDFVSLEICCPLVTQDRSPM